MVNMPNITQNKAWKPTTRFSNKITDSLAENMEWQRWMTNYNGLRRKDWNKKCNGLRGDQRKKDNENNEQEIWTGV